MIISKTPLRVSFFGGGTDFAGYYENSPFGYGATISTALDANVFITVNRSFEDKIRLCYAGNELVDHVDQVEHNLIREAMKIVGIETGVEIFYSANLPLRSAGIGLASSSAISVGVLNALYAFKGVRASAELLARKACEIEIDRLGQRIGVQDQFAVAFGGFNTYKFYANGTVDAIPVIASKSSKEALEANLMLFFTGLTRDSSKILAEQETTIADKMDMLNDLVIKVEQAAECLNKGDIDNWGYMLDESWQTKKRFAQGVSTPLIDSMYDRALAAGALGGKILGAGGGGFLLVYAPKAKQEAVRAALHDFREVPMDFAAQGSRIIFSD